MYVRNEAPHSLLCLPFLMIAYYIHTYIIHLFKVYIHTYIHTYIQLIFPLILLALVFRPENLYILMPIAGYAYVFHHSIPSLAHPVPETHKSSLNMIFSTAILISFVAYVCMAVTVSSYFEEETLSPSNLNWAEYIG